MPVLFKMSDDKKTENISAVVIAETPAAAKPRNTKKYVIIAVSGILAAAIILAAILVGMYMFTEAQKEIIKYSMKLGDNGKQEVTSDPNENVVQYHVSNPSQETWIVNDFNKDIQLMKIISDGKTNCYVAPLNRTNAVDPSKINALETKDLKGAVSLVYRTSDTPITETSFLSKTAREMCKGVSIYWLYPSCSEGSDKDSNATNVDRPKTKREIIDNQSPYYVTSRKSYYSPYYGYYVWIYCVTGCCRKICACSITFSYYYSGGQIYCQWIHSNCPPAVYPNPVNDYNPCNGPQGLSCPTATYYCD